MKKALNNNVYIVEGCRTQMGKPYKSLKTFKTAELASRVINNLIEKTNIRASEIGQVILGNTLSAGLGQNVARESVLLSVLPDTIPAYIVDNVCGSSLQSLIVGYDSIFSGRSSVVLAVGAESITHVPFLLHRNKIDNFNKEDFIDGIIYDGLFCQMTQKLMGELVEFLASKYKISRQVQDEYAFNSHFKALEASKNQYFLNEMIAIDKNIKKESLFDDCIRKRINIEKLSALPPVFREGGTVTAGNSSNLCDGAAAVLMVDKQFVKEKKLRARSKIVHCVSIASDPKGTYESGVIAIEKCLKESDMTIKDIDIFEICEAFAAQMVYIQEILKLDPSKVNVFGGDIALGHPMGASGLRAVVTLMNALDIKRKEKGLVCVSFGGGGSIAIILEREEI